MAEPENHTLRLLREIRGAIGALDGKLDDKITSLDNKIGRNHEELQKRIDSLRQAMLGESVLGRYATAEFDERLSALEQRVSALESRG
jgi:polyhydroxyalkanoate synthesis regulator phasin